MKYDWIVIGSGFGGSVSALRLRQKGYSVAVLEKGSRKAPQDYPKSNWDLRRWMWLPRLGCRGIFKMTFLPHVTALSGVGVGGGSLVYANTLPLPKASFFSNPVWSGLADWQSELAPHYELAQRMLGVAENPELSYPDEVLSSVAGALNRRAHFHPARVGIYFGTPGETRPDPYFGGQGPARTGCIRCGGCMLGCRHGAKNTLDLNYLYLAERHGAVVVPETEVTSVRPADDGGYGVEALQGSHWPRRRKVHYRADRVIFAGGVMGTVPLLLKLREDPSALPRLSARLGHLVRTNSESLIGVVTRRRDRDLSRGLAIGSILHTDEHSHLEPVRYPAGSGFFRIMALPHVSGDTLGRRAASGLGALFRRPLRIAEAACVPDWAKYTMILLYMRSTDGHLQMKRSYGRLSTALADGPAPRASMPEADALAKMVAARLDGEPQSMLTETLLGIPTTAHILGGCAMGRNTDEGVIDSKHRLYGHSGLYVIDGSAVSANPGVNPSLTITALAERAMSLIPPH